MGGRGRDRVVGIHARKGWQMEIHNNSHMRVSASLSDLQESRLNKTASGQPKPSRPLINTSFIDPPAHIGDSPYRQRSELGPRKRPASKDPRATLSGSKPFSVDQFTVVGKDGELPQSGSYMPPYDKGKLWTVEQMKYIDKYDVGSLEATIKNKTSMISELQRDLVKYKADIKRLHEDRDKSLTPRSSPTLAPKELAQKPQKSVQQHKLLEKTLEQSKKLKDLLQENKDLTTRVKDLERLFLNAKTKLDQSEAKSARLTKELSQMKEKYEDLVVQSEYYRTMKLKAVRLMGQMTKPQGEKRMLEMRFMELEDGQVPILVEILKQCPYAESLDLEGNMISDAGVRVLCEHLKSFHCRVSTINLNWNLIDLDGAWAIVEAIMGRDYQIENNIAKVSQLDAPQKISKVTLSFNRMTSHTILIKKVMEYLKKTQKQALSESNVTKKALMRASAKTVGQAFKAVNETFAELAEIKSLTTVLDRIHIEQHDLSQPQMETRKLEERSSAVQDFLNQQARMQSLSEANEKSSLFASVLHQDEKNLRRNSQAERMIKQKQVTNVNDIASSLTKELNIPFLLSKRPAFPLSFIEKTIVAGLDVNAVDKNLDETLLMYAARTGNLKLAQLMVEKRAIIDQTNVRSRQSQGENAFIIACKNGNFDVVDFLLSKGSKIGSTDKNGASAMHLVVREGNHDSICRLVERGLGMNLRDNQGKTPLHCAAEAGDNATVVRLIQLGADINAVDSSGRTPAAYAEDHNHYQVLDQLTALGARNVRSKLELKEDSNPSYLANLGIGGLSSQFKEFLSNADRTYFSLHKTQDMLEERDLEKMH